MSPDHALPPRRADAERNRAGIHGDPGYVGPVLPEALGGGAKPRVRSG